MLKKLLLTLLFVLALPLVSHARVDDNVFGFAWSYNTGWIKLNNCASPTGPCDSGAAYGVNIEQDGDFEGYGWSPNVGWVDFGPTSCGPRAKANFATNGSATISGWIQVRSADEAGSNSGGWNGCIKMSETGGNGVNYGVTIAQAGGGGSQQFSGYAWNANNSNGVVVGESWVSFSEAFFINNFTPPSVTLDFSNWSSSCSATSNSINLSWTSTNVTSCQWGGSLSGQPSQLSGSGVFQLGGAQPNFNITLTCNSSSGTVLDAVAVSCSACSDGEDNDGDGLIDSADPGCRDYCSASNDYLPGDTSEVDLTPLQVISQCSQCGQPGQPACPGTAPKYEER